MDNIVEKTKESPVVTLLQAKSHCNVDPDFVDDDVLLTDQIDIATSIAEDYTGRDIAMTLNSYEEDDFKGSSITFQEAPFDSIVKIAYLDDLDQEVILTTNDYKLVKKRAYFTIKFNDYINTSKLTVEFRTGYTPENIPKSIFGAILIKVNDLYDMERTSHTVGVNYKSTKAFENALSSSVINRW